MPISEPITIAKESDSELTRQRWVFSFVGNALVLDRYSYDRRRSKKQPFKVAKFYERGSEEDYGDWAWLTEEDVPWDEELKESALDEVLQRIRVVRESEL